MQYLRILLGVAKLAPYIAATYRNWQATKAQKQKQRAGKSYQ